jgi:hypothetical protein
MREHPFYLAFGAFVLMSVGFAQYSGLSMASVNEVKNIPRSVRDNPGAYRSIYVGNSRYIGGK